MSCALENLSTVYVASRRELAFRCEKCGYQQIYRVQGKLLARKRLALYLENLKDHGGIEEKITDSLQWKERAKTPGYGWSRAKMRYLEARGV